VITPTTVTLKVLQKGGAEVLKAYQQKRAEEARETLRTALSKGKHWAITEDQAAAALFAYMRAAEEGAARVNLEMIAEAFANSAQEPSFAPDEFRHRVRMLASLSREEVNIIAQLIKATRLVQGTEYNFVWIRIKENLDSALVGPGKYFKHEDDIVQYLGMLQRTGLVIAKSAYGGLAFYPTKLLLTIERLVDFEKARVAAEHN
jgi:hypothetical protein